MSYLSITKPISKSEQIMAKKCKWANMKNVPVRKNILPKGFAGQTKINNEPITIGTKLNRNNVEVLEFIMGNDKLFHNQYVTTNLTELLKEGSTIKGEKLLKNLLKPETLDKIENQKRLIKINPRAYIKDKDVVKYIKTPAGLNSIFSNANILKAASVLDSKNLDKLFRMDITEGYGQKLLDTFGKIQESDLIHIKNITHSKNPDVAIEYLKIKAKNL